MKKLLIAASVMLAAGCTNIQKQQERSVGMANPASEHCIKQGGKLDIVKESGGEVGYCTLPTGERIEEWSLLRRDSTK